MSDEEKEAIERIEDLFYQDLGKGINKFQKITLYEDGITDIRKLLNLIEKQSKEIEELKEIKFENERTIELFIEGYKRIYKELDIKSLVMNENILINEIKENFTSNDKIKAKIEEVDIQLQKLKDGLTGRKTNFVNKNMLFAQKEVLQSLLEKE